MGDKFDGALAVGRSPTVDMDITEAMHNVIVNETLVTKDENENTVLLRAVQNPVAGGIMMVREQGQDQLHIMQEAIKHSQMTSMLADHARCSKYKAAIEKVLCKQKGVTVLDIGTGTGLLAMFAAKAGASHVTAVEMFEPLAKLAVDIIQANDLQDKISVVCAPSTNISSTRNDEDDTFVMCDRADILVTEIFDSALLGENCLRAIRHAHQHLLREGAVVIPARARLYGTVICSDFFAKFHSFPQDFSLPSYRDVSSRHCKAASTGIPVHMDGVTEGVDYEVLTEPFEVFEFDFTKQNIPLYRLTSKSVTRTKSGRPNAIFTWWELDLTESGDVVYSTRTGVENWQDHWLQIVYLLPNSEGLSPTEKTIDITAEHDENSVSFACGTNVESSVLCECGVHSIMTPYRIYELGDNLRLGALSSTIRNAIERRLSLNNATASAMAGKIRCVDISDNSVCAVLAGQIQCARGLEIYSVEEDNELSSFYFSQIANSSTAAGNEVFVEYDPLSSFINREMERKKNSETWEGFHIIMSEPFTRAMHAFPISVLGNLIVQRLALSEWLDGNFTMVPSVGCIQAQLVSFPANTLQRSFKPIENVQGLDLRPYSRLLEDEDREQSQRRLSLPLFQYRVIPRSEKTCVQRIDFCAQNRDVVPTPRPTWIALNATGEVDAITLCVEYDDILVKRASRFEIIWLSEAERRDVSIACGVDLICEFSRDIGTWEINIKPSQTER